MENPSPTTTHEPTEVIESNQPDSITTELLKQIQDLQNKASEQQNLTLRALADLDNYRKRAQREKEELRKWGNASLIEALLPTIDNLQLGLSSAKELDNHLLQGFQLVHDQLLNTLKENGLNTIDPKNEAFDPNTQECVSHIPNSQIPENQVLQVVRKGYILNERLLRPASVIVSSGTSTSQPITSSQSE